MPHPGRGRGNFTYSGLALQDIKDGKIATMGPSGSASPPTLQPAGKAAKLTGDIVNLVSYDIDRGCGRHDPRSAEGQ